MLLPTTEFHLASARLDHDFPHAGSRMFRLNLLAQAVVLTFIKKLPRPKDICYCVCYYILIFEV
jgi:hypothetical protein